MAIIVTLLIFELRVPILNDLANQTVLAALWTLAPKIISFAVSFFTIAIYWVNHHHFFSRITHTDWKLLWANNLLLFWLTVVPFTTAFIGDYPTQPVVVSAYAFVLGMGALSFSLMGYYAFFIGNLLPDSIPLSERRMEWKRTWWGIVFYFTAAIVAFGSVYVALIIVAVLPFLYVVPNLMRRE